MKKPILVLILSTVSFINFAQTTNDVLELLIKNKSITQEQADSVRAEAAIKQQDVDANKKSFFVNAGRQMQLSGYTQIRYRNQDEKGKIDGFDIRRARLDLKGNLTPYFSYRLQADFAASPKLLDAYADIKIFDFLNFTIGQAKIPFSLENLASSNKMESIDRSQVVEAMIYRGKDVIGNQNGRDIGVQAGGSLVKYKNRFLFDYKIGVFNGAGINIEAKNETRTLVGRLLYHPIKGIDVGGSYATGKGNFGTPPTNQGRQRFGTELSCDYKNFSFRGEYISGKDGAASRNGWYAQAGYYVIPQKLQFIVKYDVYDPNTSLSNNLSTNYILGGTYNFNNWSRIQAGYTFNNTEGETVVHNNLGVIQFQISF
jgi:phosphate-selective porin OprO and OprP